MLQKITKNKKLLQIIALILLACISFVFSSVAASAEFHETTIEVLDDKKMTAMSIYAGATALSTGISLLPDDIGTSLVSQLSEIGTYILLITCVIFFEKFLLTTAGMLAFAILIPVSCFLGILYVLLNNELLKKVAVKLTIFGLVLFLVVPLSVRVSVLIEDTHEASISATLENIEDDVAETENESFWDKLKGKVEGISDDVQKKMNNFIDAIAVMLITTCAIPLAVLAFMIWVIKMLFGVNIDMPKLKKQKRIGSGITVAENDVIFEEE